MPQLVWTAGVDGTIDYFNQGWIDYTGISVQDLPLAQGVVRIVHPDDVPLMNERWNEALRTGNPYEIEYRLRRGQDGSYRWFLARAVPVRDEEGGISHWIGTATDIDDQRRARESLEFVVEAGSLLSASLDEESICREVAAIAVHDFADWCFVTIVEPDGSYATRAIAHKNADLVHYLERFRDKYPPSRGGPLAQVLGLNIPMLFSRITPEQLTESAQDEEHLKLLHQLAMHSAMIVPLAFKGEVFGAITMISAESGHLFDHKDLDVALAVASRAGAAMSNTRRFDEARRTSQRLRFSAKISQLLIESSDLDDTFQAVAEIIVSEMADAVFVARIEDDVALRAIAAAHRDSAMKPLVESFVGTRTMQPAAEKELIERLRTGEPIVREHLNVHRLKDRGWPYLSPGVDALKPTSAIVVPLATRTHTFGAIFVYYTDSGRYYDLEDLPGLVEISGRASIAIENAETLERERRIATTFQRASLPSIIPRPAGLFLNAIYSPAGTESEVGGDWYDVIDLDDGSVVISVGDVTGQGIEAAAVMSKVRHALGVVPLHERDPARILDSAGWFLSKRYPETIVTAFVGIISPDRKTIRFANAGHPYPILRRGSRLIELKSSGLPLGLRTLAEAAPSEEAGLQAEDFITLYTDGLIEGSRDWKAGEACLNAILQTDAIVHSIEPAHLIEQSCVGKASHDDVAVLTVLVGDRPQWSFKVDDARAAENARLELVEHLRSRGSALPLIETAELIFGELIGNVVRHAPGPVEVELEWTGDTPTLHVIDSGKPFRVPDTLPDTFSESGRGLFIVRTIGQNLCVERMGNYGNHVRVSLCAQDGV